MQQTRSTSTMPSVSPGSWSWPGAMVGLVLVALLAGCGGGADEPPPAGPASSVSYNIGGQLAGLDAGKSVTLAHVDAAGATAQSAVLDANGAYSLRLPSGTAYSLRILTQPAGQTCTVTNGSGTASADVSDIAVTCADITFRLGGIVAGSLGGVALRNTVNGDTLTLNGNGVFTFTQPVVQGGSYEVVLADQGAGQTCSLANGAGAAGADVTDIAVNCTTDVVVGPPLPVLPPTAPTGLAMSYGIKSFNLAWDPVAAPVGGGTVSYRLLEDPDGVGPAAAAQIGGTLVASTYTQVVAGLLPTRLNAQYSVQACNSAGCSTPTAAITPNLTQAIGYFKASNTQAAGQFGRSIALSGDGNTLAVGAMGEGSNATGIDGNQADNSAAESGAVYVFSRTAGGWAQQAYLKASNAEAGDLFSRSLALSADGSTLAVGAVGEGSNATGVNGDQTDNSALQSGAVYVFTRTGVHWTQQAYVKASNPQAGDFFGWSLALSGDGNTLAAGAYAEDSNATGLNGNQADNSAANSGAVYVFSRSGASWAQQAYVKASNPQAGDFFGSSLALSGDGNTLAAGAYSEDSNATGLNGNQADNSAASSGAVYVFSRSGASWAQQAYVKPSNTKEYDFFGYSVALSGDGTTLAVAAYGEASNATGLNGSQADASANNAGAVYVFSRAGGSWAQQAFVKASNTQANDQFGGSVSLSGDGNTLAVGAYAEDSNATGLNGNQADNSALQSGAVYVFTRTGASWAQQSYVKAPNPQANDQFGYSVVLSSDGNTLAAGANAEGSNATGLNGNQADNSASGAGAVYIY